MIFLQKFHQPKGMPAYLFGNQRNIEVLALTTVKKVKTAMRRYRIYIRYAPIHCKRPAGKPYISPDTLIQKQKSRPYRAGFFAVSCLIKRLSHYNYSGGTCFVPGNDPDCILTCMKHRQVEGNLRGVKTGKFFHQPAFTAVYSRYKRR